MKIVIIGCGKVGQTLTEYLRNENHDISVIDLNGKLVEYVSGEYDVMGIEGTGVSCDDLRAAGADKADLVLATTSEDEVNLLACTIAGKMGARHCIARVRNPRLNGQLQFMRETLGITDVVNPEYDAAAEISRIVRMPSAIKVDSFAQGRIDLAEFKIEPGSILDGVSLFKLPEVYKESRLLICAVTRGSDVIIPRGDFKLAAGDRIHVTAPHADLGTFFKKQGEKTSRVRSVMVVGGGRITYHLVRMLLDAGVAVKIIEIDRDRCTELSAAFPKAKIICGDGTDQDVLVSEGLDSADVFVALTGMDEENIIISMYAKSRTKAKVITKINRISLNKMMSGFGLDSLVSPKLLTANTIVRYVRAVENVGGSEVVTLYKLVDNKVEALEFIAAGTSRLLDVPLKDLQLKNDVLFAGIIRAGKVIFPTGSDSVHAGDRVVIVTTNRHFNDLDEILA